MGRGSFAHHGVDPAKVAWTCFRVPPGRLRARLLAGRSSVRVHLSALGMAAALFCRRIAGTAHAFRPRQSERAGSLASFTHRLASISKSPFWKWEALRVSRCTDGHGELHFPWHAGHVSHVSTEPAQFHTGTNLIHNSVCDGRRDLRRLGVWIFFGPQGATPRD